MNISNAIARLLPLCCLIVLAAAGCTPAVQVQVTLSAPTPAGMDPWARVSPTVQPAPPIGDETNVSSGPETAPWGASDSPTEIHVSQMRLAAPMNPTATPSPTATPTPLPPATSPPIRIAAPAINLDANVVEIGWTVSNGLSVWEAAAGAAGFHRGSALPGAPGNTVISGHHNIQGKVFERVHELRPGDRVRLLADGIWYDYVVEDNFILPERDASDEQRRQNARWIAPTDDERLTLVTCWPANNNTHRVIVIARPAW